MMCGHGFLRTFEGAFLRAKIEPHYWWCFWLRFTGGGYPIFYGAHFYHFYTTSCLQRKCCEACGGPMVELLAGNEDPNHLFLIGESERDLF